MGSRFRLPCFLCYPSLLNGRNIRGMKLLTNISLVLLVCIALMTTALAQGQPDPVAATLTEARALITQGNPAAAIAKLQALPQSADPRVAQLLGVAFYTANDHVHAIQNLTAAVDKLPKDSAPWREAVQILGLSHYILGHLAEAVPSSNRRACGCRTITNWLTRSGWLRFRRASLTRRATHSPGCFASRPTLRRPT